MTNTIRLPSLKLGDLTVPIAIIQGGMGVAISMAGLASAVANEGGIGVIATPGIGYREPDRVANYRDASIRGLRKEIKLARSKTKGVLGVNIMSALSNYEDMARTAMDEGIDVVISGAGLPMNLPAYRPRGTRSKLIPIVSSDRAATIIAQRWMNRFDYLPDAMIIEGPLAGGHLGFKPEQLTDPAFALERLLQDVLAVTKQLEEKHKRPIPVLVAGGIYTGADILRFLNMGAAGVQMATRFVTTVECDASLAFKQAYLDATPEDLTIINSPVGLPGRAIRNKFLDDVAKGDKKPFVCNFHCIVTCDIKNSPYCIAHALLNARRGKFEHGFAFAGANAWRAERIITVHRLFEDLQAEFSAAAQS